MSKPAYKITPGPAPDRLKVLSVLSATPSTHREVRSRLRRRKKLISLIGHRIGELCTLGLAEAHGKRGSYTYSLTPAGETFLEENGPDTVTPPKQVHPQADPE